MRFFLAFIVMAHGLIHTMGFAKAFGLAKIDQVSRPISKPMGLVWLLAAMLFIATFILYLLKKEWWSILAIISVILSQGLIFIFWRDAKFGTIANIIILIISIPAYGKYRFTEMAKQEALEILGGHTTVKPDIISKEEIAHVPPIVQKWMEFSGVVGKPIIRTVRLKQKGEMKTEPNGKWMPFTAEQYFNTKDPSFVWIAQVKANALLYMEGRDKLQNAEGAMLIKLFSLLPVVNEKKNQKIDSGSLQRYLAETCWFPSAAFNDAILWEANGRNSAQATFVTHGKEVSGFFEFTDDGKLLSFETERYYGGGTDSKLQTWRIELLGFKEFDGIKIPHKCNVIWKLPNGDFNWLNLEITDLEYNVNRPW